LWSRVRGSSGRSKRCSSSWRSTPDRAREAPRNSISQARIATLTSSCGRFVGAAVSGSPGLGFPRRRIFTARTVVRTLPRLVHGLIALAYFVSIRLALRRRRRPSPVPSAGRILICGRVANHNATRHGECEFTSRFWGTLPQVLVRDGYDVQWLHYFHAHRQGTECLGGRQHFGSGSTRVRRGRDALLRGVVSAPFAASRRYSVDGWR